MALNVLNGLKDKIQPSPIVAVGLEQPLCPHQQALDNMNSKPSGPSNDQRAVSHRVCAEMLDNQCAEMLDINVLNVLKMKHSSQPAPAVTA